MLYEEIDLWKEVNLINLLMPLSINLKFETGDDLNKFEENSKEFFQDLKKTFVFKQSDFSGIYVYNYESELTSTELSLN